MKTGLKSLLGISIILILFSCNNTDKKNTSNEENKDYSEFAVFYGDFQEYIANDNIEGLKSLSSEYLCDFLDESYESHVTPEMKNIIAETPAAKVETINNKKLISYRFEYEDYNPEFEAGYSTYGFWFEKVNGKWLITEAHAAG